jgi:aminoglycoside 6-adenylyltransferase
VRALILESSRAAPNAPLDKLSDFDLLVVVSELEAFEKESSWLGWYDTPLVRLSQERELMGLRTLNRLVLYEDGTKVDHIVWPIERLLLEVRAEQLADMLDVGYRVLLDKDSLTSGLQVPTYRAHIPSRPTEAEFLALVEEFWWESTYVAKNLWREELLPWKYALFQMTISNLRRMLEWRVEIDHAWSMRPGRIGRGLKQRVAPALWAELEATFVGPGVEENWRALVRLGNLFSETSREVGASLGFRYPEEIEQGMRGYWEKVRILRP